MERVKGVEPSSPVWKTGALTVELHPQDEFDYTKLWDKEKFGKFCRVKATDFERLAEVILSCWKPVELAVDEVLSSDNFWQGENKAGLVYLY